MPRLFCRHRLFILIAISACHAAAAIEINTVSVGNINNSPDANGFGRVSYNYRIGQFEVTNAQYAAFLNAVDPQGSNGLSLYDPEMTSNAWGGILFTDAAADGAKYAAKPGVDDKPVGYVSWYDSIRFANWMHNGQGNGDTETGAYSIGPLGPNAVPINGTTISRNPQAKWFLTSEDEWYKAAYHQPLSQGGDADDYWDYPTRTNTPPYSAPAPGVAAPDSSNTANFFYNDLQMLGYNQGFAVTGRHVIDLNLNYLSDVGAYVFSVSHYGTFDQAGNVDEWIETPFSGGINRGLRGSSWAAAGFLVLPSSSYRNGLNVATGSFAGVGFRLATLVPEPATAFPALWAPLLLLSTRRRGSIRGVSNESRKDSRLEGQLRLRRRRERSRRGFADQVGRSGVASLGTPRSVAQTSSNPKLD